MEPAVVQMFGKTAEHFELYEADLQAELFVYRVGAMPRSFQTTLENQLGGGQQKLEYVTAIPVD